MVVAALAYFENIRLIIWSTVIFAVHHLVGYLAFPELICGTADYPFGLLMIHALFLLMTSLLVSVQIVVRNTYYSKLKKEKDHAELIRDMMRNIADTSDEVLNIVGNLEKGSKETEKSSQVTVATTQDIVEAARQLMRSSTKSRNMLDEVLGNSSSIIQQLDGSKEFAKNATDEALEGKESMKESVEQMYTIAKNSVQMGQVVERVENRTKEIQATLQLMTEIA